MPTLRHQRIRELLKRQLSETIRQNYPLEQHGPITINDIQLTPDLKTARAYITLNTNNPQKQKTLNQLQKNRRHIQKTIAHQITLKHMPHIRFILDTAQQRGDRVLQIIQQLEQTNPTNPQQPTDPQQPTNPPTTNQTNPQ